MGNPNNNDPRDNQHLRPEKREKRKRNYQHGNTEDPAKAPGRNVKVPGTGPAPVSKKPAQTTTTPVARGAANNMVAKKATKTVTKKPGS